MKMQGYLRQAKASKLAFYVLKVLVLAAVYHGAARMGLSMAYVQMNTSPVWPPMGIALAALVLLGYGVWPGITLGVLLGSLLTGADFSIAIWIAAGNTLEALICAFLLRRFIGMRPELDRVRDVIGLVCCSLMAAAFGATSGTVMLLVLTRISVTEIWSIWSTWWIGDLLGAIVVAPAMIVWITKRFSGFNPRRCAEGVGVLSLLALVTWYVFVGRPIEGVFHRALIYMVFPFTLWIALRLGQRGTTLGILIVSGIATWGTVQGFGPFSLEMINDSLVLLQTFMAVVSLTALVLAAASSERRMATATLRQRADDLSTLNASSKSFLDNVHIDKVCLTICELAVSHLGLDGSWIEGLSDDGDGILQPAACGVNLDAVESHKAIWESSSDNPARNHYRTAHEISSTKGIVSPYQSYASNPLRFSDKSIAVLKMVSKDIDFFSLDRRLLIQSFVNLASVAIQNALLFEEIRGSNRQLRALSRRFMKAHEQERLRLSRELHDESGQLLAALTVKLGLLQRSSGRPSAAREHVRDLQDMVGQLQEDLHRIAVHLRPASLDHLGLVTAIQQYIRDFSSQYGIEVEFDALGLRDIRLSTEIETALYRVIQESLTNVALHAQASRADVLLDSRDSLVSAIIEDNGVGFGSMHSIEEGHLGLFGMRERVEMLGGQITIESGLGTGTTIKVEVPHSD